MALPPIPLFIQILHKEKEIHMSEPRSINDIITTIQALALRQRDDKTLTAKVAFSGSGSSFKVEAWLLSGNTTAATFSVSGRSHNEAASVLITQLLALPKSRLAEDGKIVDESTKIQASLKPWEEGDDSPLASLVR
jgi:hypothetical protein